MTLLFIDTNIFLDFYRQVGRESNLSILKHLRPHHDRIITTRQVEMEFKKNRPRVIATFLAALKAPDWGGLKLPAYLASSASGLSTGRNRINDLVETIQKRGRRVFEKPTRNDPVYKVAQRLFAANTPYSLSRSKEKEQKKTLRLAWRRFLLGYPPRKATDTSIGDAVNWEWIVNCAKQANANVVIVSRDSDYGVHLRGGGVYINDWLAQEFRERVNRRLNVTLTDKLSEGLKQISIRVTKQEVKDEDEFLQRQRATLHSQFGSPFGDSLGPVSFDPTSGLLGKSFGPVSLIGGSLGPVSFDSIGGWSSLFEPGKMYEDTVGLSLRAPTLATPPAAEEDND